MYRDMPKKMIMNLQIPQSITQRQAFLYNAYANKTKTAPVSVQKPASASLSKMTMVGRIQGIKSGCGSCGK
jgi:hypothetical protein